MPADLVAAVGSHEVTLSPKTKDPAEARCPIAEELVNLEARRAALWKGPRTQSEREAHQIAVAMRDAWLTRHGDEPSAQAFRPVDVGARAFTRLPLDASRSAMDLICDVLDLGRLMVLEQWYYEEGDRV